MSEPPEFPQERPVVKYIVQQVAKIEDAQACGVGYYKSLGKVLGRLDKTDQILSQLNQTAIDLKKVTDADVIAGVIGKKSDDMNVTIKTGLISISDQNVKAIDTRLKEIGGEVKKASGEVVGTSGMIERIGHDLHSKMGVTIDRLDKHIKDVDERLTPPLWKIYAYTFIALLLGIAVGKWI